MASPYDPCAPAPPRCPTVERTLFQPGISVRHTPVCPGDLCYLEGCGGGNWRVVRGTLDRSRWIEGWIMSQLMTRGEVSCDEHPLKVRDGGWWFDAFRPDNFKSGSKLWALNWARVNPETLMLAKQWAEEALQYLIQWGIASSIAVDTRWICVRPAVIKLSVHARGPGIASDVTVQGTAMPDSTYLWKEYVDNPLKARAA